MNTEVKEWPMTEEYPPDIKPTRPGVYLTRYTDKDGHTQRGYSMWDGERWSYQHDDFGDAVLYGTSNMEANQDKHWRGLPFDPALLPSPDEDEEL